MNEFVPKPFDRHQLLETVARLLSSKPVAPILPHGTDSAPAATNSAVPLLDDGIIERLARDVTPEAVPGMIQVFLSETVVHSEKLKTALREQILDVVADEAHALKGSAGTFGAARLQGFAQSIEAACREGNRQLVASLGGEMDELLEQTLAAYRERFGLLADTGA
jgi:HPt (histidine-containing phosphotransfer) domain-containing protein